jgi:hypothetical protein
MMGQSLKRVLIIHPEGNLFNNPSVKSIVDLLLDKGYEIDFRYQKSHAPMPHREGVRLLPFGVLARRLKPVLFDRICFWPLVFLLGLVDIFIYFNRYCLIIGIDREGLIEASVISKITGTPLVFISFEILFESETSVRYKSLERKASRNVAFWLVQDEVRAGQLQKENALDPRNKMLLPLASAGIGCQSTTRLRDHLGVPDDKKIAIFIGSVAGWSMIDQVLKSVAGWPEDWALIVHDRYGGTSKNLAGELSAQRHLLGRKIFISNAATEQVDDMGSVLSGVSVGLAFYEPDFKYSYTGNNLKYLGLASGKICTYLRYGIPVVMNEIGLFADEARLHRFGYVVEDPNQIHECLNHCLDEQYGRNALGYFKNKLDFNLYRDDIWQRLSSV